MQDLNIFGEKLATCSNEPMTGYMRSGCCESVAGDAGRHILCAEVNDEFLKYSASRGNDLMTPRPEFDFNGLKAGDRWCLCAARWYEAYQAGVAVPIIAEATHEDVYEVVPKEVVLEHLKKGG